MGESSEEIILTNDAIKKEREQPMTTNTDLEGIADNSIISTKQYQKFSEETSDTLGRISAKQITYGEAYRQITDSFIDAVNSLQSIHSNDKLAEEIKRTKDAIILRRNSGTELSSRSITRLKLCEELLQFQEGMK